MSNCLISKTEVLLRVCLSKSQLHRLIKDGEFPRQVPIGRQRVAFLESEVNAWIESRLRLREEGHGVEMRRQRAIRAVGGRR